MRQIVVAKKADFEKIKDTKNITEKIVRTDKYGNSFFYYLKDETRNALSPLDTLITLEGIFDLCKARQPKVRVASIPVLPPLKSID